MSSLSLLQGIFPTQGSNSGLLHSRWILYHLSQEGSPGGKEVCFILDTGNAGTGAEDSPVHSPTALTPRRSRGKSFYRQRRVLRAETAHLALMVILRLVIGG